MDLRAFYMEDTSDARTAHPADTVHPSDAALLRDTVRLPGVVALPMDATGPAVKVRDPEAACPPATPLCSRRPLLCSLGTLVLLLGVSACGPIALFTRTQTLPPLTITTSPDLRIREKTEEQASTPDSNIGCPNTTQQGFPVYAKLLAKNEASLSPNRILSWHSKEGAGSSHLSPGLRYDEIKQELVVDKAGFYCVFLQLKLSPTSKNTDHKVQGWVSLVLKGTPQVDGFDNSGPTVELSPGCMDADLVERSWSGVVLLQAGHRLSVYLMAYLHGAREAYQDWQLSQQNTTSFGLFSL